jgi:hypothetical protein
MERFLLFAAWCGSLISQARLVAFETLDLKVLRASAGNAVSQSFKALDSTA